MTDIWHINIDYVSDQFYLERLLELPVDIQGGISRYVQMTDKKLKLFGRLMLEKYITRQGAFNWNELQFSKAGKPFIENQPFFNIAHAGSIVMIAFSLNEIGVDIEKNTDLPFDEISVNFHPNEIQLLEENNYNKALFFSIWSRKEALLKAMGTGIVNGLSAHDCMNEIIEQESVQWHIQTINIETGYSAAVCQKNSLETVEIKQLTLNDFVDL